MVEIPTIKKNSSVEDNISWRDIQGLSWILSNELEDEYNLKADYACA